MRKEHWGPCLGAGAKLFIWTSVSKLTALGCLTNVEVDDLKYKGSFLPTQTIYNYETWVFTTFHRSSGPRTVAAWFWELSEIPHKNRAPYTAETNAWRQGILLNNKIQASKDKPTPSTSPKGCLSGQKQREAARLVDLRTGKPQHQQSVHTGKWGGPTGKEWLALGGFLPELRVNEEGAHSKTWESESSWSLRTLKIGPRTCFQQEKLLTVESGWNRME